MNSTLPVYSKVFEQITVNNKIKDCSILVSDLGKVLVLFSSFGVEKKEKLRIRGERLLFKHVELAANHPLNFKFAYGLTGLSWIIQFLKNRKLIGDDYEDFLDQVDNVYYKSLKWDFEDQIYDPFIGYIGKAHYLFERQKFLKDNNSLFLLESIVNSIETSAIRGKINKNAITWLDFYSSLHHPEGNKKPYYNLGLAHGVPAIICFLNKCAQFGIKAKKCKKMIKESTNWLLSQEEDENIYPSFVWPDRKNYIRQPYILSWCYGILSVAISYYISSKTLKSKKLESKALELVIIAADLFKTKYSVADDENGNPNLFLCHGSFGIAYILYKFNNVFDSNEIKEGYKFWIKFSRKAIHKNLKFISSKQGLLEGISGIFLIDLHIESMNTNISDWDSIFFLDLIK